MIDVDAIALEATHRIENAFAVKRGKGGYVQRRAAVQVIIANTIRALSPPEPTEAHVEAAALAICKTEGEDFELCSLETMRKCACLLQARAALRAMPLQEDAKP